MQDLKKAINIKNVTSPGDSILNIYKLEDIHMCLWTSKHIASMTD